MMWVIRSEKDMTAALVERRRALHLSQEQVEHDVGLTRAHLGKVENAHQKWGKRVFRIMFTLECLLEYYGMTLVVVDAGPERIHQLRAMAEDALTQLALARRASRSRCRDTIDLFRQVSDRELVEDPEVQQGEVAQLIRLQAKGLGVSQIATRMGLPYLDVYERIKRLPDPPAKRAVN